jgi:heme/copper-type cytochrome/quinol oxidase subunit 2
VAIAAMLVLLLASVASACPGCKDALETNDPTHGGMVRGYFYSILFMMGTPYLLLATFCGCMYYKVRANRRRQAATSEPAEPQR